MDTTHAMKKRIRKHFYGELVDAEGFLHATKLGMDESPSAFVANRYWPPHAGTIRVWIARRRHPYGLPVLVLDWASTGVMPAVQPAEDHPDTPAGTKEVLGPAAPMPPAG